MNADRGNVKAFYINGVLSYFSAFQGRGGDKSKKAGVMLRIDGYRGKYGCGWALESRGDLTPNHFLNMQYNKIMLR